MEPKPKRRRRLPDRRRRKQPKPYPNPPRMPDDGPYLFPDAERRRLKRIAHFDECRRRRRRKRLRRAWKQRRRRQRWQEFLVRKKKLRRLGLTPAPRHVDGYLTPAEEKKIIKTLDIDTLRAVKSAQNLEVHQLLIVRESHRGAGQWTLACQCANRLIRHHAFNVRHLYRYSRGTDYVAWWLEHREEVFAKRAKRNAKSSVAKKAWRWKHESSSSGSL